MQVFTSTHEFPENLRGGVAAIGNFDGIHKGHQVLVQSAIQKAQQRKAPAGVLTFSPHPRLFFQPDHAPFRLSSLNQKRRVLDSLGADFLAVENFDDALSRLSPEEFVSRILVERYGFAAVIVGFNFHFGSKRSGDAKLLETLGQKYGLDVYIQNPVEMGDTVYSSSLIRQAVQDGDLEKAADMLGWTWEIEGPVLHGDKRGRTLGYPTANQSLRDYIRPPYGIYAVRASLDDTQLNPRQWYNGVANLGVRPMFQVKEPLLETYIFDFNDDIYERNLRVQLVQRLRGEKLFPNVEELTRQMRRDEDAARQVLE